MRGRAWGLVAEGSNVRSLADWAVVGVPGNAKTPLPRDVRAHGRTFAQNIEQ
jgi:hypothetical protein